jgi:hypothetical protein
VTSCAGRKANARPCKAALLPGKNHCRWHSLDPKDNAVDGSRTNIQRASPAFQSATIRLEMLLHLAVVHCRGARKPMRAHLSNWVNNVLADLPVRRLEDPPEDVFISNVIASGGNYRIFEGTWEGKDAYLQDVLTCLEQSRWAEPHVRLKRDLLSITPNDVEAEGTLVAPRMHHCFHRWANSCDHRAAASA